MPENLYVFETRNVNFLEAYIGKAKSLGFNVTVTNHSHLENNKLFNEFMRVYKHYSVNTPEFEIACFARYFSIASVIKNNNPFILTDSDLFITKSFRDLQGFDFKGVFTGSEGFESSGKSEKQISPHCTIWNRELLLDFIHFTIDAYKQNAENNFLEAYYQARTERCLHTAVSDMNLIYLWIKANNVPFINTNSTAFEFGIDHNISVLRCEDDEYLSFADRKYLKAGAGRITCFLKSGKKRDMALLHFQGEYKAILKRFYSGRYAKFIFFSLRNNYRRNRRILKDKRAANTAHIRRLNLYGTSFLSIF